MTVQAANMQQYLTQLASLRQDASSPSTITVRSTDHLNDLIERFPSRLADDSPTLGRRPSLDDRPYEYTLDDTTTTSLTSSLASFKTALSSSPVHTARPRAPIPSAEAGTAPEDPHLIPRSLSARELPASNKNSLPLLLRSVSDASPRLRPQAQPITPSPTSTHRKSPSNSKYPPYATTPAFVIPGEAISTPPLPDLPDPSMYPDPYPYHPRSAHQPQNGLSMTPPISLFSEGSSSASTRSSLAYNSHSSHSPYGTRTSDVYDTASDDHSHRRGTIPSLYPSDTSYESGDGAYSGETDRPGEVGVGLTSDEAVHLAHQSSMSSFASGSRARVADPSRWSGSSFGRAMNDSSALRTQQSFDWDVVDERDEFGLGTDDEETSADDDNEDGEDDMEADRTAAIVMAEEGKGMIVHGEGLPVDRLIVRAGTTHLLLSGSSTPNQMPPFLATVLMNIPNTLLALDISCNLLPALPPALASCVALEELNIAANPLRVLPAWLANLTALRVLIADSTAISALPQPLVSLKSLHTLSLRRNRLFSLPAWLCHLNALETLLVEGNPFLEPWASLVAPLLLSATHRTPIYPPNTPQTMTSPATTDTSTPDTSSLQAQFSPRLAPVVIEHAPNLRRSMSSPQRRHGPNSSYSSTIHSHSPSPSQSRNQLPPSEYPSTRPRADPSTSTIRPAEAASASLVGSFLSSLEAPDGDHYNTSSKSLPMNARPLRRMKSADELSRVSSPGKLPALPPADDHDSVMIRRFESLPRGSPRPERARMPLSMFADSGRPRPETSVVETQPRSRPPSHSLHIRESIASEDEGRTASQKTRKWGFLKKMSMGRMRSGSGSAPKDQHQKQGGAVRSLSTHGPSSPSPPRPPRPGQIIHSVSAPVVPKVPEDGGVHLASPPPTPSLTLPQFLSPPSLPSMTLPPVSVVVEEDEQEPPPPPPPPKTDVQRPASRGDAIEFLAPPQTKPNPTPISTSYISLASIHSYSPTSTAARSARRRSFLPINFPNAHLGLEIPIPSPGPFINDAVVVDGDGNGNSDDNDTARDPVEDGSQYVVSGDSLQDVEDVEAAHQRELYNRALRSVMAYLRDLSDLSGPVLDGGVPSPSSIPSSPSVDDAKKRRPTLNADSRVFSEGSFTSTTSSQGVSIAGQLRKKPSSASLLGEALSVTTTDSGGSAGNPEERKHKDDKIKRAMIVKEIVTTERTYVSQLQELVDIYVNPASALVTSTFSNQSGKETMIPVSERRIVFNGVESLLQFHKESFLPALEKAIAPLQDNEDDLDGILSTSVASQLAMVFVSHAAFMKMYSTYINNFDNCVTRIRKWVEKSVSGASTPAGGTTNVVGLGLSMSVVAGVAPEAPTGNLASLTSAQKKRIKTFLKRCRSNPRHSQLNLEGYLLLPVQRIPRYRLLLEDLARNTPPRNTVFEDPLEVASRDITALATNMNEGKRESESRRKLLNWQSKIRGKFPSPLVQPHRRLIMDGNLNLSRVVRKNATFAEVFKPDGERTLVQVDCLQPELTPRPLIALLCNDMLVLCKDPSHGTDRAVEYDLWAVLRMQTTAQPASVVHGSTLRLVDNRAILYFDAASTSDALTWSRAINTHIPASR